jgi:hypothetical protein
MFVNADDQTFRTGCFSFVLLKKGSLYGLDSFLHRDQRFDVAFAEQQDHLESLKRKA